MTEPGIIDGAQRAAALRPDESFIVQAPAGSGKTELLTQRYLRLLATVDHPEEICAITFTRKAAAEMRNRILAALDAATGAAPQTPHRRLTWELSRAALARDAALDWGIRHNPNRLRIQTFDSLSHALARQMPLLSELGAAPLTTERAGPHYRDAARATLARLEDPQLGPHLGRLLAHLDNRQAQLETLLAAMLARRDQWLPHALASPDGATIEAALREAVEDHLRALRRACPADWLQRLALVAGEAAVRLGHERPAQPPGTAWDELASWLELLPLLVTAQGKPRRSWDAKIGFPAPTERGLDAAQREQRKAAKAEIAQLAGLLEAEPALLRLWAGLRTLPPQGPDAQQHALLGSLLQVLLQAAGQLLLLFQERGEVDFAEIQMRAQRALGSPEQPTDLALALDYRLRHLLVDEFQDTSSSQYRLLATLTAGWQAGDGRSLFAVGDPMQSIYRFREAEVGLYLAAREQGIGGLKLTPLTLQVNFRSTGAIVDWINRGFPHVMPIAVDLARGAVPYTPAVAFHPGGDPGAVQVHPFAAADAQAEAARVVELVRSALAETEDGQVAILARARSHLQLIARALAGAGLRFQAVDVDPLAQRPLVLDLHQLTRALLHPGDRLAWLAVLRAPWLGLDLRDLLLIAEGSDRSILGRLRDPALRAGLSADGRSRVERLLELLGRELPARGRRPLRQWVEGVWLRLGGLAVAGEAAEADAQAYLALLEQHEQAGGLLDFGLLDEALQGLYAAPDSRADGRIQLMTMHKAKGLEFDTVILPGLGRRPRGNPAELLYWLERTAADGRPRLLMAPVRAAGQDGEPIADYLRELERDKDRLEAARVLYVAATRARRRLHLLGHIAFDRNGQAGRPAADSLLQRLWPVVEDDFARLSAPPAAQAAADEPRLGGGWRLPADWRVRLPEHLVQGASGAAAELDTNPIEFAWAGDTARHVGTLVHRWLERIALDGVEQWPASRVASLDAPIGRALANLGVPEAEQAAALDKTLRALRNTLADDRGRWLLGAHAEARCEWPLTWNDEGIHHYVIDRSFVDPDQVRWIVDYKTGEHLAGDRDAFLDQELERYRAQLETYARVVREIDIRPIRLALYFPLFGDWRTWEYAG
jgi:ATP-dependent exoDNAse (exonuclease V) beta subunit